MGAYSILIQELIKSLPPWYKIQLLKCLKFINTLDRDIAYPYSPVIFIEDVRYNILMRLALMIKGKIFYVIPTNMTKIETLSYLTEIHRPYIITDSKISVKGDSIFAKIIEFNTILEIEPSVDADIFDISPSFVMILYSDTLQRVATNQLNFTIAFKHLESSLNKEKLLSKVHYFYNLTDEYFIYYLVLLHHGITPYIMSNKYEIIHDGKLKFYNDRVLYIPYEEYRTVWREILSGTLQNKLLFKWFFHKCLGRIIIRLIIKKFERYFKSFKHIIVLGLITDSLLAEISEKLRHSTIYNVHREQQFLMFFGLCKKPGYVSMLPNLHTLSVSMTQSKKKYLLPSDNKITTSNETSELVLMYKDYDSIRSIPTYALFTTHGNYAKYVGYAFSNGVCPAYIESIFNSFPFIKDCALIWWQGKYFLALDVDEAILDANRINYLFFDKIMKGQIKRVNQEMLPEEIQISSIGQIPATALKYNRWGLLDKNFLYKVEFLNQ